MTKTLKIGTQTWRVPHGVSVVERDDQIEIKVRRWRKIVSRIFQRPIEVRVSALIEDVLPTRITVIGFGLTGVDDEN
jgi:hypothetical protein